MISNCPRFTSINRFINTKYRGVAVFLFFLIGYLFFPLSTKEIFAQVVINEVFPNPVGDEAQDEWVELYNSGSEGVDLDGFLLRDANNHELIIGSSYVDGTTVIGAGGWLLVRRNGHSTFSLNNSGDETISLCNLASEPVNSFSYNGSKTDRSWGRIPDGGAISEEDLDPSPGAANISSPTPTPTPTSSPTGEPTPTSTSSTGTYKINEVKDADGAVVSSVMIYVDGEYVHHYAPETLTFCDGCTCDTYVDCGFGSHTISLEKSGYDDWNETVTINIGNSYEVDPVMDLTTTSTPTPTPTKKPTASPTGTPGVISAEGEEDESLVLGLREKLDSEFSEDSPEEKAKRKFPVLAIFLILGGTGLVGFSAYSFLKGKKKGYNIKGKEEDGGGELQE